MLIQQKREREFALYKGLTVRTIIQAIWLIITAFLAYYLIQFLFNIGLISYAVLRARLAIPYWVPDRAMLAGMMLVFMVVMQFFFVLGFVFINPLGRIRPGNPSTRKSIIDPLEDNQYHFR